MSAPVDYIPRIRDNYARLGYGAYKWVENSEPSTFVPLPKPLSECRVTAVCSGGVYASGQVAFHFKDDTSFRAIPSDTAATDLRATHFAYDTTDARRDPDTVFPIRTLSRLAAIGAIGAVMTNLFSFMGGIYSSRRVTEILAPAILDAVQREKADAVLLVPV